ncbi:hypothetical protein WBG99_23085 [Streptomyces sp. TG1A-60]|uniref:hypothetical protein n=1 Tax=Streptomyces sp. TG1A-60 TaxID=3129111 RepID=UPI0030CBA17F
MALKVIGGDVRMVDPAEYDKDIPRVQEHLRKFERAFGKVRGTHKGRPVDKIRQALLEEFGSEGLIVWSEVADDAARRIAEEQADEA